jgi:hypothetical protein
MDSQELSDRPPILQLDELNDKFVKDETTEYDPVKKVISTVFLDEQSG